MKLISIFTILFWFLVWLGFGVTSIDFLLGRIIAPHLSSSRSGLIIILSVGSIIWLVGGILIFNYYRDKERRRAAFAKSYHAPHRLELREHLFRLKQVKESLVSSICFVIYFGYMIYSGKSLKAYLALILLIVICNAFFYFYSKRKLATLRTH